MNDASKNNTTHFDLMNRSFRNLFSNCSCPVNVINYWTYEVERYLISLIASLGLVGNLTTISILRSPQLKSTFYQSLLTLSICDILFIFFLVSDIFVDTKNIVYIYLFPYFWNPLKNIVMTWETLLIMSIATERYLAVCKPLHYRRHKLRNSSYIHVLIFILPGLICSFIINIPKFFESELLEKEDGIDFQVTTLRLDMTYNLIYTFWTRLLTTGVIPAVFLLTINILIITKIKSEKMKSLKMRANPLTTLNNTHPDHKIRSPNYLAVTLTAIILIFLVCNLPRLCLNIIEYHLSAVNLNFGCVTIS